MTNASIVALEIANRWWEVNKFDIKEYIISDMASNDNTPAEFNDFASEYKVNHMISNMTLDTFIIDQLDFLDLTKGESITPKIWNHMCSLYESLVDSILEELEDTSTNDERTDYYRDLL